MIIPAIAYQPNLDPTELVEQLTHWSLFGQVALTAVDPTNCESLEFVVKRVGGLVDLLIELTQFEETVALALLNVGATSILSTNSDQNFGAVPEDRIRMTITNDSPDEAVPSGYLVSLAQPTPERIAELEMARVDCLIDAKLLTPDLITDFFKTVLVSDRPDELWSTVIVDPLGTALGLAYSNDESLHHAIENRVGTYWSRSRGGLWIKGETSGATQQLINIRMDCDRDCLRFMVTQAPPGFCHRNTHSCFCLLYTSPSPRDATLSRMPSSA